MGTRHLICVKIDDEYKVAQYGQWDGYLSGQGLTVLNFLRRRRNNYNNFKKKLRLCQKLTDAAAAVINSTIDDNGFISTDNGKVKWQLVYPELSRDTGAMILNEILHMSNSEPLKLRHSLEFSWEYGCEYAYVIDFDTNTFEVFTTYNENLFTDGTRFNEFRDPKSTFCRSRPVCLVKQWQLDKLPTKREFLKLQDVIYNQ